MQMQPETDGKKFMKTAFYLRTFGNSRQRKFRKQFSTTKYLHAGDQIRLREVSRLTPD
jgi:hypothetical protein